MQVITHCLECGDRKPLGPAGICRWRAGCEHRVFQHEAVMDRLNAEMAHDASIRSGVARIAVTSNSIIPTEEMARFINEKMLAVLHDLEEDRRNQFGY